MKRYFVFSLLLGLFFLVAACTGTPAPTPSSGEVALTMIADKVQAEATQAAVNNVFTATAQVLGATATQQAAWSQATSTQQARIDADATQAQARRDAQATAEQKRRDVQATQARIDANATQAQARRDAQATADQARLDLQATQQAAESATAFAVTAAVIPTYNLWTQQAVEQAISIGTNAVELSNLQVEQQRQKNTVDWALPASLALLVGIVGSLFVVRLSRTRAIADEDGAIQLIIQDNKTAIQPRLLPGPVLTLDSLTMPQLVAPDEQAEVTKRAQAVQALGAMPVSPTANGVQAFNSMFGMADAQKPRFEILEDGSLPTGMLNSETLKVVEGDWKESDDGG